MDITKGCVVSGKHGFDLINSNRFAIIEVEGKRQDTIQVNKVDGLRYSKLWGAFEHPQHEDHPIVDNENKIVVLGGESKPSRRTVCIVGE